MWFGWDRRAGRAVARPAALVKTRPGLVDVLRANSARLGPLLEWEDRHGDVTPTDDEVFLIAWFRALDPGRLAGLQLHPWTSVIDDPDLVYDTLRIETARGHANPGWFRALDDLARIKHLLEDQQ